MNINLKKKIKKLFLIIKGYFYKYNLYVEYFLTNKKNNNISICISTTKGYSDKTIPILINSLKKNNIDTNLIYVFEGGWEQYEKIESDFNYFKVPHNSFDLTALISILELKIIKDYWLLLHDTLELDDTFYYKFRTLKPKGYDCLPLKKFPSMNIGVYSNSYLIKNIEYILSTKNVDYGVESLKKYKSLGVDFEDHLFKITKNKKYINEPLNVFFESKFVNYFSNERILEKYNQLGIKKYKANYYKTDDVNYKINI